MADLRHGHVPVAAEALDERTHQRALVLERVRVRKKQLQCQQADHHRGWTLDPELLLHERLREQLEGIANLKVAETLE